jgi:putative tryptophan/tyrosine transport system substrate-binding protein
VRPTKQEPTARRWSVTCTCSTDPDVIVTLGTPTALAAKRATTTIPIVMAAVGDPLRSGVVASLAHPGANITGVTLHASVLSSKRIEVLKEAAPGIARLAVLGNATNPYDQDLWEETRSAALALRMEPQLFTVRQIREIAGAFATMRRSRADAVVVLADAVLAAANRQISVLATEHRLPAMYDSREYVEGGGFISYGPNIIEMVRCSTRLVDKILKGANPADLPIEQPAKFELVINLKAAKALGLTIPPSVLALADEVIE